MYENIVSFVARGTDSGKTYLLEKLISEFKNRGMKVAAVKHANHFAGVDREGKDTHRFARKGADRASEPLAVDDDIYFHASPGPNV